MPLRRLITRRSWGCLGEVQAGAILDLAGHKETLEGITGSGTVSLGAGILTLSASGLFSGAITGSGGLIKNGSGALELRCSSSYTGGTTISSGSTILGTTSGLQGSIANAGQLEFNQVNSDGTFTGTISGAGALTKGGSYKVSLANDNTFTGLTTIELGTLEIASDAKLGSVPFSTPDQLTLAGLSPGDESVLLRATQTFSLTANRGVRLTAAGGGFDVADTKTLTVNGVISDDGVIADERLVKKGLGTLALAGANTCTAPLFIREGTLKINASNRIANTVAVTIDAGATFNLNNYGETIGSLAGAGNVTLGSGGLAVGDGTNTTFSGVLSGSAGALTKTGSGKFILSGANTYTGATTISQGILRMGAPGALDDQSDVTVSSGATFDLSGCGQTVGSLSGSGSVTLGGASLGIGVHSTSVFSGVISGSGAISKVGATTLTLSGANTFSGPLSVSDGTLILSGTNVNVTEVTADGLLQVDSSGALPAGRDVHINSGGSVKFNPASGQSWTMSQYIDGPGDMVKTGAGTVILGRPSLHAGNTTISAGTLRSADMLQCSGGTVSVASGATLEASGVIRRAITGSGDIVATGPLMMGGLDGSSNFNLTGTLNVGANSVALLSVPQAILGHGTMAAGNLSSLHGIQLSTSFSGYGTIDGAFVNSGAVTGGSGANVLNFRGPVSGTGSFAGNVQFSNIYSPGSSPAQVSLGNVTFVAGSLLQMELGGSLPGSGYDQLVCTGAAELNGVLSVGTINGYLPLPGASFTLLTGGVRVGQFASLVGLSNVGGRAGLWLQPTYTATGLSLVAGAIPGDANLDGVVSFQDYIVLEAGFGKTGVWTNGNFNGDSVVDFKDYIVLEANFGKSVPEPGTLSLLALAGLAMLRRRR